MWTAPASQGWCSADDGFWSIAVICPAFGTRHGWPLAQMGYADRVPNRDVMSVHRWIPRVVPILGPTDRHLAAVLASARERDDGLRPPAVGGRVRRSPAWP